MLSQREKALIADGESIRRKTTLPFWETLMLCAMKAPEAPREVLRQALFHNREVIWTRAVSRLDVLSGGLSAICDGCDSDVLIAMSSEVECQGGYLAHVPQIDFHCPDTTRNLRLVEEVVTCLQLTGYVLRSGKSFHFLGTRLLHPEEFVRLMASILLFSPITDRAWVAHQLIEGKSALRISARPEYGGPPRYAKRVQN